MGREDGVGVAGFHHLAQQEERCLVGNAQGLQHVVGHHDHRVALLQLADELLDLRRGNGIEGACGLVEQQHPGCTARARSDAQALLLAAGQAERVLLQTIPSARPRWRPRAAISSTMTSRSALARTPMAAGAKARCRRCSVERVGLLEHHTHATAQVGGIQGAVGVGTVEEHRAFHAAAFHQIVHAVQRLQQRGLAATGGADERRHLVLWEGEVGISRGPWIAVEQVQVLDGHLRRSGVRPW